MIFKKLVNSNIYGRYLLRTLVLFDTRQKLGAIMILLFTIINSLVEVLGLALIIPVIYLINDSDPIFDNHLLNKIYELSGCMDATYFIFFLIIIMVVLFAIKNIFSIYVYYRQNRFAFDVSLLLIERQTAHMLSTSYLEIVGKNSNYIVREVANIPSEFATSMLMPIIRIASETIILSMIIIGLMMFNFRIFLLVSITIIPMVSLIIYGTRKKASMIGERRNTIEPLSYKSAFESVFGFADIKLFNKQYFFIQKIRERFRELFQTYLWIYTLQRVPNRIMEIIIIFAIMLLYGIVVLVMQENSEFIFMTLLLFATAAYRVMPSLNEILASLILMHSSSYVLDILHEEDIQFREFDPSERCSFNKSLELKDIHYTYPDESFPIFSSLNLTINKGDAIGIYGDSGSGKSTLMRIIVQLLHQQSGQLLLDGREIVNSRQWFNTVAYVQQNFYLLDSTIAENIAFGFSSKDIDNELLTKSIRLAGLEQTVSILEKGVDTEIGEFGVKLSGGQQQRIVVARALYKGASLLLFDESTSTLDPETEENLLDTLMSLNAKGITILMVSHKQNTLRRCNLRYKLLDGKLLKVQ